jgi:hypothetical protein
MEKCVDSTIGIFVTKVCGITDRKGRRYLFTGIIWIVLPISIWQHLQENGIEV